MTDTITANECTRCLASKTLAQMIDVIHPVTGRTLYGDNTIAEIRTEYADVKEMEIDEFCAWRGNLQRSPIAWEPTTCERYDEQLGCVPPAAMNGGWFLVGEPWDDEADTGLPRFIAYRIAPGRGYEVSNRPMTVAEFRAEMTV